MRPASRLAYVTLYAVSTMAVITALAIPVSVHADSAPTPLVVVIDPGHGGSDSGMTGQQGTREKDVNLDIAKRLSALLQSQDVNVVMTRSADDSVSVASRSKIANAANADALISIHTNSFTDTSASGSQVLYPNVQGAELAQNLSLSLQNILIPTYHLADNGTQLFPDLWQHINVPSATVEAGYMSNPNDENLLRNSEFRQNVAMAMGNGLATYLPVSSRKAELENWNASHGPLNLVASQPTAYLADFLRNPINVIFLSLLIFLGIRFRHLLQFTLKTIYLVVKTILWPIRALVNRRRSVELVGKRQATLDRARNKQTVH